MTKLFLLPCLPVAPWDMEKRLAITGYTFGTQDIYPRPEVGHLGRTATTFSILGARCSGQLWYVMLFSWSQDFAGSAYGKGSPLKSHFLDSNNPDEVLCVPFSETD